MNDLINKLSSYNLFNYLFPGVVFAFIAEKITKYSFLQPDIVVGVFIYYFLGLLTSRFGSLIVEPLLKKVKFINFSDYSKFVLASKKDPNIEVLSEANNAYRTLCSTFSLILLLKLYEVLESNFPWLKNCNNTLLIIAILIGFLLSYRKQTKYINRRIEANLNETN